MATSFTALILAAALAAPPVAPDSEPETARQLFEAGSLAYDQGNYSDAVQAFEAAYRDFRRPEIAFSLAQSLRRQFFVDRDPARLRRAQALYRVYLQQVPLGGRRQDAIDQLQAIEPIVATQEGLDAERTPQPDTLSTQLMVYADVPGAEASIDGGAFRPLPWIQDARPGTHEVVVRAVGFAATTKTTTAVAQRLVPVPVELSELPAMLQLRTSKGAHIFVDGREVGRAPTAQPILVASGAHVIAVKAPGRVHAERTLTFERDQRWDLAVHLPPTRQRQAAWGLLGSGGVLLLAGGATMGAAFAFQRDAMRIDDLRGTTNITAEMAEDLEFSLLRRDQLRGATAGLLSAAVVAGAVGLVVLLTDRG